MINDLALTCHGNNTVFPLPTVIADDNGWSIAEYPIIIIYMRDVIVL